LIGDAGARWTRRASDGEAPAPEWRHAPAFEAGESARTEIMKADRRRSPALHTSKDVPRFAPNFTVYLLPPDAVCLYSEDRKFFLHGELYHALAAAIGEGEKSFRELVSALKPQFPVEKIEEALTRLLDRGHLLPDARSADGTVAAYWASLGLSPENAAQNLRDCGVRIEAIDVEGADALGAALREFGVRLVKRSPDLSVTLVSEYLDRRVAELNRQHLADRTPWLMVQPSGVFPLVGPLFSPGKSACWSCLVARMARNREIKGMLDRGGVSRVAVSPLARRPVGQSGIALAAIEIAKAIATDFRTDLSDHIISLDLSGATIAKHYVAARPQCPTCGHKKLSDPRRAPRPIALDAGGKLVMTSGGYRSVMPRTTVSRFRRHVSPLTGVVSRLEPVAADLPLNTNYYAVHNFSAPAQSIQELKAGLSGGSFGKGSTAEQGEASALMEAIERYSGVFQGDEIRVTRRFTDFAPDEAIPPNDSLLYSDAQYRAQAHAADSMEMHTAPEQFDPSLEMEWTPVWSLRDRRFRYLPTSLLYFFYRGPGQINADSNGCAAGNTLAEAIVQGFLELVERDAYSIWWYNRLQRPQVDLDRFDDPYIRDLRTLLAENGHRLWVLDITNDLGIPSYVAIAQWTNKRKEKIEFGSGSHFEPRIALLRAITELNQFLSIGLMDDGRGDQATLDGVAPLRLKDHPYLTPSEVPAVKPELDAKFSRLAAHEQVEACVNLAKRKGLDFLVLDQTRADIAVPVVKVVVPGLRHFYRRFAPGRLYDVPVKLGWRNEPLSEDELNPHHPHT
jgi:ribosomal protein S12 methylthiotransferase accessory factor